MPRKRKQTFFCSMCTYSCSKATSLQNHKCKCNERIDVMETNEIVNNDVAQQVTETNITETNDESNDIILCENNDNVEMEDINFNIPEDYEDFVVNECQTAFDVNEMDAMDYDVDDNTLNGIAVVDTNNIIDTESLMHMYTKYKEKELLRNQMDDNFKYAIELLALLKNSNVSDALYDKIVDWLAVCSDIDALNTLPKREKILKQLTKRYDMENLYPVQKECVLPSIGLSIHVPVHSYLNSLFSLLTASDLMKSENLLFADPTNPSYVPPRNMSADLGDINTGNAYYDYYERMNGKGDDVIVSLMFFADGMQIDKNGRIGQEPWMYTLGIFNRSMRNQPRAWRNIGLTKLNAENLYTDEQMRQSKKNLWKKKRKPQPGDDNYVTDTLMDWHSHSSAERNRKTV